MKNLQELYDAYLLTKPYSGKIKAATTMMIHVCKALNLATQEEITYDYYTEIPKALDSYFVNYPLKSTQDKGILAEMIGRIGPDNQLGDLLDKLLEDKDDNVRQFSFHSLEFIGKNNPEKVIPYIERYRKSTDPMMKGMAAHLSSHLSLSKNYDVILNKIEEWFNDGDISFVQDVLLRIIQTTKQGVETNLPLDTFRLWLKDHFGDKIQLNY